MNRSELGRVWDHLKNNVAFRVGTVYAGASWFLVEAADTLGASTSAIRVLALVLAALFLVLMPLLWLRERTAERRASAESSDMHWGVGAGVPRRRRRGTKRWLATTLGLTVVAAGLLSFRSRLSAGDVPEAATRLAVLPFHATGSDGVREFGIGMVDLLTTALSDVGGIRTVSSRTVLARTGGKGGTGLTLEESLDVGRSLGAGSILTGSITTFGSAVRLTAEIREVAGSGVLARAEVDGSQDSMLTLTDRLAVSLLRELWRSSTPVPTVRIGGLTTSSPMALREYLRGEEHLRAMHLDSAADAYRRAIAADSTFALAWLRLSDATAWNFAGAENLEARNTYVERALALADRLPQREQSFARAMHLAVRGAFASLDSLQSFVNRYPDDPIGWYQLGDARFHAAPYGRFDDSEVIAPFLESVRLDPALGLGLQHLLDMALEGDDRTLFDSVMHHYTRVAPERLIASRQRQADVRWAPPDSALAILVDHARGLHPVEERWAVNALIGAIGRKTRLDSEVDPFIYVMAQDSLARLFSTDRYWQRRTTQLKGTALATLGRARESLAEVDRWVANAPPEFPFPPDIGSAVIHVLMGTEGEVPAQAIESDVRFLEQNASHPGVPSLLHVYFLTQGDPERAARYSAHSGGPGRAPALMDTIAAEMTFRGWLQLIRGEPGALDTIDAGVERSGFWYGDAGMRRFHYALALSPIPERRGQAIRMFRWYTANAASQTGDAYFALARALEAEGDYAGARSAYNHVYRLWRDADPFRHPARDEAFAALTRLRER